VPLYFFNLYNDDITLDDEGQRFPGLASAQEHGLNETRIMAAESVRLGKLNLAHRLEITDEDGTVLRTIQFGDAVRIVHQGTMKPA
jgi:hypothetical protein